MTGLLNHQRVCVGVYQDDSSEWWQAICGVIGCGFTFTAKSREAVVHAAHVHEADVLGWPLTCSCSVAL